MRSPHAAAGDLPRYDAVATYATDPDRDLVRDVETFVEGLHRDRLMPKEFRTALAMCVDGHDFQIPRPGPGTSRTIDDLMHDVVCATQRPRVAWLFLPEEDRGDPGGSMMKFVGGANDRMRDPYILPSRTASCMSARMISLTSKT